MKKIKKMIVLVGILILIPKYSFGDEVSSKHACESLGGKWGNFGLLKKEQCNLPTSDAGKECSDSKQCESACVADIPFENFKKKGYCSGPKHKGKPCQNVKDCGGLEVCVIEFEKLPGTGTCYGWTNLLGTCLSYVENEMISSPLCVD